MEKLILTKEQARKVLLTYHGLAAGTEFAGKAGILDYIKRVGCIQFDTLNIVGRNPDLVLQSRVKRYREKMLHELLYKDRLLVDEWDKEMSIYPMEDWPYFQRNREAALKRYMAIKEVVEYLPCARKELEQRGPLSSSDLSNQDIIDWSWAPTRLSRAVLESMYLWGELIVFCKAGSRKTYDFASKYIPRELLDAEDPNKTMEDYHAWNVLRRIGSVGLLWNKASDAWLGIKEFKSKERVQAFASLLAQGKIIEIQIEGMKYPLYIRSEYRGLLEEAMQNNKFKTRGAIIAPLDNLLWDRRLIQELFDFEYRWEVYKPAAERQYGYYVLPVLYGDRFVARFEPVLDKKTNTLNIKGWWWEAGVKPTEKMRRDLKKTVAEFMHFTGADNIAVGDQSLEFLI